MSRLRVGIAGCGRIARAHAEALATYDGATASGVADVDAHAAHVLAAFLGCASYRDPLDPDFVRELDAVIVCTPPSAHFSLAHAYLERGIAVMCEKPLTITAGEASALVDLAHRQGTLLTMASKFRHVEDIAVARALIARGALGRIAHFEIAFTGKLDMSGRWNSRRDVAGGGVVTDNGSHGVDLVRHLLGPIVAVQASFGPALQAIEVEDTAKLCLRTQDGTWGVVELTWSYDRFADHYAGIYGSTGAVQVGWHGSRHRLGDARAWQTYGTGYDKAAVFRRQLEWFVRAARGEVPAPETAEAAYASVRVVAAAYESATHGLQVHV